ncbi:unnamed protein product [Dovyalis caffra]|uniref:Calcineurin-like phosphoesterase domain-containing protein n=1 Tax=Dovyalis caffra TaxID=77055 RepID=A0AAV1RQJ5_9ROSI|nr:unnamed protein product [Dovyalis caffra]
MQFNRNSRNHCITRPQILPCAADSFGDASGFRVFVLSDLHTDYPENMKWVKSLSTKAYKNDVLLLAGDVAETYRNFHFTMSLFRDRFQHVFYVPGNHDLWCRTEPEGQQHYLDSLEKLNKLLDACRGLGVQTRPMALGGLGIVPLFSWYHESFDREQDISGTRIPSLEMVIHFLFCSAQMVGSLASDFLSSSILTKDNYSKIPDLIGYLGVIHANKALWMLFFRQELCPEKRMLFYPNLPKIIGSDFLEVRIRSIHGIEGNASACHAFGHTHFCWDSVLDGIRIKLFISWRYAEDNCTRSGLRDVAHVISCGWIKYPRLPSSRFVVIIVGDQALKMGEEANVCTVYVQAPLAYPRERKRRMNGGETWLPFCVYSGGKFADRISPCHWSDYYAAHPRAPHVTELAPWVARFYNRA